MFKVVAVLFATDAYEIYTEVALTDGKCFFFFILFFLDFFFWFNCLFRRNEENRFAWKIRIQIIFVSKFGVIFQLPFRWPRTGKPCISFWKYRIFCWMNFCFRFNMNTSNLFHFLLERKAFFVFFVVFHFHRESRCVSQNHFVLKVDVNFIIILFEEMYDVESYARFVFRFLFL